MKKLLKKLLIIALIVLVAGGAVFGVGILVAGGDINALSHLKSVQEEYVESADNQIVSISINYENADLDVVFSDVAESVTVSYPLLMTKNNKAASDVYLSDINGKLQLTERIKNKKTWLGWNFLDMQITLTLPASRNYALSLSTDNGGINVSGTNCALSRLSLFTDNGDIDTKNASITCSGNIDLETDNGKIALGNFSAVNLTADVDNGGITLSGGNASEKVKLSADNGKITVNGTLKANSISMETDNGSLSATNGVLNAERISLESDNGNIKATVAGAQSDYSIYVEIDLGDSNLRSQRGGERTLSLSTDNGDIYVSFTD